jgi:hypothetical protein
MSAGDLNRLIEGRALDDVEAAHLFFSLGDSSSQIISMYFMALLRL